MPLDLVDTLTPTDDQRLAQAQAVVRAYCGWHIAGRRTDTVTLPGPGGRWLVLPTLHLVEVISVTEGDDTAALDATAFTASDAGVLTKDGYWTTDPITVEFTHGYQVAPAEVTAVVQSVAQRSIDNPGNLVRKTRGPFTDQYGPGGSGALADHERWALGRYKIVNVA